MDDLITHTIELDCSIISKRSDGIVVFRFKPGKRTVNLLEAKAQLQAFLEIQQGERSPVLCVVNQLEKLESDEKAFMNANLVKFATCMCIVTDSPIPTFIFNIAFYLSPPPIPSKILKTEKDALIWLKKQEKEKNKG
jgi:hypothetical protein